MSANAFADLEVRLNARRKADVDIDRVDGSVISYI